MAKKRGLGCSFDSLLTGTRNGITPKLADTLIAATDGLRNIPIEYLQPSQFQPRRDMNSEALEELAESIKAQGIIQPITVRQQGAQCYEIIAGERRWRAAQLIGFAEVPVIIKDISDKAAVAMALIENIQREDLNPLEEAIALQRLIDEFDMTHQGAADSVGKSRTAVTNLLRLLNLNDEVKLLLAHGDLDMGHTRALLALDGEQQNQAAKDIVNKGLSVRQTERLVRDILNNKKDRKKNSPTKDNDIFLLQQELSDKLGARVNIKPKTNGNGTLVIHYNSLDELEGILAHIK